MLCRLAGGGKQVFLHCFCGLGGFVGRPLNPTHGAPCHIRAKGK